MKHKSFCKLSKTLTEEVVKTRTDNDTELTFYMYVSWRAHTKHMQEKNKAIFYLNYWGKDWLDNRLEMKNETNTHNHPFDAIYQYEIVNIVNNSKSKYNLQSKDHYEDLLLHFNFDDNFLKTLQISVHFLLQKRQFWLLKLHYSKYLYQSHNILSENKPGYVLSLGA